MIEISATTFNLSMRYYVLYIFWMQTILCTSTYISYMQVKCVFYVVVGLLQKDIFFLENKRPL